MEKIARLFTRINLFSLISKLLFTALTILLVYSLELPWVDHIIQYMAGNNDEVFIPIGIIVILWTVWLCKQKIIPKLFNLAAILTLILVGFSLMYHACIGGGAGPAYFLWFSFSPFVLDFNTIMANRQWIGPGFYVYMSATVALLILHIFYFWVYGYEDKKIIRSV